MINDTEKFYTQMFDQLWKDIERVMENPEINITNQYLGIGLTLSGIVYETSCALNNFDEMGSLQLKKTMQTISANLEGGSVSIENSLSLLREEIDKFRSTFEVGNNDRN